MDLRDYARVLRRRWLVILATALIALGVASLLTVTATPQYTSSARLFVSTSPSDSSEAYQGSLFSVQRVTSYANLASESQDLAQSVIDDLELNTTPGDLLSRVTAEVIPDTVNLTISIQDPDPRTAQALAQTYAENLTALVRELETPPGETTPPIKATIVDPALLPASPVSPTPVRNLVLGLLLGLLLGVGLALLREAGDTTVKTTDDLEETLDAPILAAIGYDSSARSRELVTTLESHAPRVEAFRVLRTNLQFVDVDRSDKLFVVTSALPGEGKTSTAVNLAITMAQAGPRTLLIEGDLRRPKAAAALGLDQAVGVTTVLLGKVSLDDAIQKHDSGDLNFLGSGAVPPNPAELIQSHAMSDLLREVRQRYDVVIIDAPPLLPVTDAALLSAQADGALLVIRHGKTTRDQVKQAVSRLRQVDAAAVGAVFNMVPSGRRGKNAGYGYGYGYGYAPLAPTPPAAGARRKR